MVGRFAILMLQDLQLATIDVCDVFWFYSFGL
jgi:hypothetical protein